MKEGRDYEKLPELADHAVFATQWKTWWASLQPSVRRVEGSHTALTRIAPTDRAEWDTLWRGGQCGLFLVIMGLAWWLYAADESGDGLRDVHDAIDDVHWVCTTAMEAYSVNVKRSASDDLEMVHSDKRLRTE